MIEIEAGWWGRWFWEERLPQSFRTGGENVWFTDLRRHHYRELGRKAERELCVFIRSPGDLGIYHSVGSAGLTRTLTSWSELRLERKGEFKLPCAGVQVRGKFIQARKAQDPIWASQTELAVCWGTADWLKPEFMGQPQCVVVELAKIYQVRSNSKCFSFR